MRGRGKGWVLGLALALGCGRRDAAPIDLDLGSERFSFVPQSAYAEYWELPGNMDQLRITLASYQTSCERHRGPSQGEILVVLTLRSPAGKSLGLGEYPWLGLGDPAAPLEKADVIPFVRLASEGRALPSGGSLTLSHLEKAVHGRVEAAFSFAPPRPADAPSDAATPPSGSLRGQLSVRLCRVALDQSRKAQDAGVLRP